MSPYLNSNVINPLQMARVGLCVTMDVAAPDLLLYDRQILG
jgi:hypothetical protein